MTPQIREAEPLLRNYSHCFINATQPGLSGQELGGQHEVILQALDRFIIYETDQEPIKVYYGVENFEGTELAWDAVPVVYQEEGTHPDLAELDRSPQEALAKVRARPAGQLSNSAVIAAPGQPRLKSLMSFSDPEVQALYAAGKLALSTALYGRLENGRIVGKVRPNHVLLFRPGEKTQPRDLGSMFLNSTFLQSNDPKEGETIDKLDEILNSFTNSIKSIVGGGPGGNGGGTGGGPGGDGGQGGDGGNGGGQGGDGGQALINALQVKDQENLALKQKAEALEAELKNAREDLEKLRTVESDRAWTALKNSTIPPGLVDTQEKEAQLRQLYNTDRDGFYLKLLQVKGRAPGSGKEGEEFTNSEVFEKVKQINDAWDMATGANIKIN